MNNIINNDIKELNEFLAESNLSVTDTVIGPSTVTYKVEMTWKYNIKVNKALSDILEIVLHDSSINVYSEDGCIIIQKHIDGNTLRIEDRIEDIMRNTSSSSFIVGIDTENNLVKCDIAKAPHMIVSGCTGSGKSVFLHNIICNLLMKDCSNTVIVGIDPKGTEFFQYEGLKKHFSYVDNVPGAIRVLDYLCEEMNNRYEVFKSYGYRDIDSFNASVPASMRKERVYVVIDEFADLILRGGRNLENAVVMLAQKSRAAGIHLIIGTQSPRKEVITGLIKANIPTRVSLKAVNHVESSIVLDRTGAEKLSGKGDLLFLENGSFSPVRCQSPYVSQEFVDNVVQFVKERYY